MGSVLFTKNTQSHVTFWKTLCVILVVPRLTHFHL